MQDRDVVKKKPRKVTMRDVRHCLKRKRTSYPRTKDPADFAFFMMGVASELHGGLVKPNVGQAEFVYECIQYASLLDMPLPDDFSGMFYYDIAEEFGKVVAQAVAKDTDDDRVFKATLIEWMEKECAR